MDTYAVDYLDLFYSPIKIFVCDIWSAEGYSKGGKSSEVLYIVI